MFSLAHTFPCQNLSYRLFLWLQIKNSGWKSETEFSKCVPSTNLSFWFVFLLRIRVFQHKRASFAIVFFIFISMPRCPFGFLGVGSGFFKLLTGQSLQKNTSFRKNAFHRLSTVDCSGRGSRSAATQRRFKGLYFGLHGRRLKRTVKMVVNVKRYWLLKDNDRFT